MSLRSTAEAAWVMAQSQRTFHGHMLLTHMSAAGWLLWRANGRVDQAIELCPATDPWWTPVFNLLNVLKQEEAA